MKKLIYILPVVVITAACDALDQNPSTAVTVDTDATTADIPEALYWADNGSEAPLAVTAADAWNYAFTIKNNTPTVILRNADFKYTAS